MLQCWKASSAERPTFSNLVKMLSQSLELMADYLYIGAFDQQETQTVKATYSITPSPPPPHTHTHTHTHTHSQAHTYSHCHNNFACTIYMLPIITEPVQWFRTTTIQLSGSELMYAVQNNPCKHFNSVTQVTQPFTTK